MGLATRQSWDRRMKKDRERRSRDGTARSHGCGPGHRLRRGPVQAEGFSLCRGFLGVAIPSCPALAPRRGLAATLVDVPWAARPRRFQVPPLAWSWPVVAYWRDPRTGGPISAVAPAVVGTALGATLGSPLRRPLWCTVDLLPIPLVLGVLCVLGIDAQDPIVMFGVLEVVFGTDPVAGRLGIAGKRQILSRRPDWPIPGLFLRGRLNHRSGFSELDGLLRPDRPRLRFPFTTRPTCLVACREAKIPVRPFPTVTLADPQHGPSRQQRICFRGESGAPPAARSTGAKLDGYGPISNLFFQTGPC